MYKSRSGYSRSFSLFGFVDQHLNIHERAQPSVLILDGRSFRPLGYKYTL